MAVGLREEEGAGTRLREVASSGEEEWLLVKGRKTRVRRGAAAV